MSMEVKKTFYKNGNLKTEVSYVDNKKNGRAKSYYENGNIKTEVDYCDGIINGYIRTYYEDGSLESVETYKHGEKNNDLVLYSMSGNITYYGYDYECDYDGVCYSLNKHKSYML